MHVTVIVLINSYNEILNDLVTTQITYSTTMRGETKNDQIAAVWYYVQRNV